MANKTNRRYKTRKLATKVIYTWTELSKIKPNENYHIVVDIDGGRGWIKPFIKDPTDAYEHRPYLSTHSFYQSTYRYTNHLLKTHGFRVRIGHE